jgi:voltage-gated sodium channel
MHGSDVYYHDDQKDLAGANRQSVGSPLVAPAYFISFILLGTMIVMNLFTGVIVQGLEEAEDEVARIARERHDQTLGHTTVGDEINVLRERLEQISQRMHLLLSEQADALQAGFYED